MKKKFEFILITNTFGGRMIVSANSANEAEARCRIAFSIRNGLKVTKGLAAHFAATARLTA